MLCKFPIKVNISKKKSISDRDEGLDFPERGGYVPQRQRFKHLALTKSNFAYENFRAECLSSKKNILIAL